MKVFEKRISELSNDLFQIQDYVISRLSLDNLYSLNANIGYRYNHYHNVRQATIKTVDEFKSLWYQGFIKELNESKAIPEEKKT
jgi:hypothetical protein